MKHLLRSWKLACCAAVSMMFVACGGGSDYRDVLPADSFFTLSVDVASLYDKSGAGPLEQHPLYARLESELSAVDVLTPEEKEYLLTLLKTPAESGLDTGKALFLFMSLGAPDGAAVSMSVASSQQIGLLLPLSDRAKFEALLDRICQKSGLARKTQDGVTCLPFGDSDPYSGLCACDDRAALLYFATGDLDAVCADAAALFAQKRSESLMGNAEIAAALSGRNDVNMVVSYAGFTSLMNNPMLSSLPMVDALKAITVIGSTNFEQGEIVSDFEVIYPDAESRRKVEEFYAYVRPMSGDLVRYVGDAPTAVMGCGLDGEKLLSLLASMPGGAALTSSPQVAQVMKAFAGDLLVEFEGMTPDGRYPIATLLAQVNDPSALDVIVANLAGMPVQASGEGAYTLNLGDVTVWFGVKDNVLYVTNSTASKSALDGSPIEQNKAVAKLFDGQVSAFYLRFGAVNDLLLRFGGSGPELEAARSVLSLFDVVEVNSTTEHGRMIVRMTDRDQNSFKSLCDGIGSLIAGLLAQSGM